MLVALTTGQKLGIALVAAAFIAFALASSFLLPRRNPNFPGRRLPLFVGASVLFFAGTMTAMILLAHEEETEAHVAQTHTPETAPDDTGGEQTEPAETEPAETEGGATGPIQTETGEGDGEAQGNAEAGSELWASEGCGGCHVLAEADSTGTVGPSLDESQPGFDEAVEQIREGGGGMPAYEGRLSDEQIRDLAAFVVQSAGQ